MKTMSILFALLFSLQVSTLFAGNDSETFTSTPDESTLDMTAIVPVTPAEATFEEVAILNPDLNVLAPVVPAAADFEEMVPESLADRLAPVVPLVADFE